MIHSCSSSWLLITTPCTDSHVHTEWCQSFFTIAINVRWLHIVITKGDMAPPIRRKNRAPHILIIVVVVSLFLSSLSSYPRYSRSILWRILIVLFVVVVLYPHHCHISIVHLEDLVRGIAPRGIVHLNAHIRLHMGRVIQVASVCKSANLSSVWLRVSPVCPSHTPHTKTTLST